MRQQQPQRKTTSRSKPRSRPQGHDTRVALIQHHHRFPTMYSASTDRAAASPALLRRFRLPKNIPKGRFLGGVLFDKGLRGNLNCTGVLHSPVELVQHTAISRATSSFVLVLLLLIVLLSARSNQLIDLDPLSLSAIRRRSSTCAHWWLWRA